MIVIPFTMRHLDTIAGAPEGAEWHDVSEDNEAYWRLLCEVWNCGEDLLVIEHDVVCRPDVVESMESCPEPWCAFGYHDMCHPECMEAWANTLGCTRFRKEMMATVPAAVTGIPEGYGRDWHNLCDYIAASTRPRFTHHWHHPPVVHHKMRLDHLSV